MNDLTLIAQSSEADRRGLFQTAAQRLGCAPENVEKDFWVSVTLDILYNQTSLKPRLLFKGGTSLSKAFGLIDRFSEDIDVTVFRQDLPGAPQADISELRAMGPNKRRAFIENLRNVARKYIHGDLLDALTVVAKNNLPGTRVEIDPDPDQDNILLHYPSAFPAADIPYIRRLVMIEGGARSAVEPNVFKTVTPYVADDLDLDLTVPNVRAIAAERTFWEKIVMLHGQRRWFENRGSMYQDGNRVSRHYYDIHCMLTADADRFFSDFDLAADCTQHARIFFNRAPLGLDTAEPGTFTLVPAAGMKETIKKDYDKMASMIFGVVPEFEEVMQSVQIAEERVN